MTTRKKRTTLRKLVDDSSVMIVDNMKTHENDPYFLKKWERYELLFAGARLPGVKPRSSNK